MTSLAMGQRIKVGSAHFHPLTERGCIEEILGALAAGRGGTVVTHNIDHLRLLEEDAGFAEGCAAATLRVADGVPVLWAARLRGTPLPGRVAGSDLVTSLTAAAAEAGRSVFLMGGDPGTAKAASDILVDRHPDLIVAGVDPFERCNTEAERESQWDHLCAKLADQRPDIVFIALPAAAQLAAFERCAAASPSSWFIGVGVSFSFLTGDIKRAPKFLRATGLEWVHRLSQQPELGSRYLRHDAPYALKLMYRSWHERSEDAIVCPSGSGGSEPLDGTALSSAPEEVETIEVDTPIESLAPASVEAPLQVVGTERTIDERVPITQP